jgi:hypothetical protein
VSPGDRSTWYYGPGDLPALEQEFADAASAARPLAQELGFELDEAPGLRQPGR